MPIALTLPRLAVRTSLLALGSAVATVVTAPWVPPQQQDRPLHAESTVEPSALPAVPTGPADPLPPRTFPTAAARPYVTPPAPRGDLPGWRQVMVEDFSRPALPAGWGAYTGAPGGNANGWWDPKRVAVRQGSLRLTGGWQGGRYTTGGVGNWGTSGSFGKYVVRFRVQPAPGVSYALLLWPSHGGWPSTGEVDFAEDGGGARQTTTASAHWSADNRQVQRVRRADFTSWHEVGVEWTPGRLVYTLDDRPWASVTGPAVPAGPMHLALQLEAGRGTPWAPAPSTATPASTTLEVDWVAAYRRA